MDLFICLVKRSCWLDYSAAMLKIFFLCFHGCRIGTMSCRIISRNRRIARPGTVTLMSSRWRCICPEIYADFGPCNLRGPEAASAMERCKVK
jgi:hypothetical protein